MRGVTETQLTLIDCDAAIRNAVTMRSGSSPKLTSAGTPSKDVEVRILSAFSQWIEVTAERGLAAMRNGLGWHKVEANAEGWLKLARLAFHSVAPYCSI